MLGRLIAIALLLMGTAVVADDGNSSTNSTKPKPSKAEPAATSRPRSTDKGRDREETAMAFVRENHPELALLLEPLKSMKPKEYERAIGELYQVSRSLAALRQRDRARYELGLKAWKAKSEVDLIAAKLASGPASERESQTSQLRTALEHQIDVEIRQQELERDQTKARLNELEQSIKSLKNDPAKRIEQRLRNLKSKAERARRLEAGKSAPTPPARTGGE